MMNDTSSLPFDVLLTNFVAETRHVPEIHCKIKDLNDQIQIIEGEVSDVKGHIRRKSVRLRTLRELRARQRAFKKTILQYEGLLSPMRALPMEMLSEIFLHCLPPRGTFIQTCDAPILLTRVCRRWKQVAIATRRLWTSLSMGSGSGVSAIVSDVSSFPLDPRLVADMWLERSGILPLDIHLQIPDWAHELLKTSGAVVESQDITQEVVRKLAKHVHRWKHFKATFFGHTIQEAFQVDDVMRASILESYDVSHPGAIGHLNNQMLGRPEFPHFQAPRLSEFILRTAAITFKCFSVNHHMLRRLTLHSSPTRFTIRQCLEVLEQCSCLEYLDISLNTELVSGGRPGSISLLNLQELCVKFQEAPNVPFFLQSLHLPHLRTLDFYQRKLTWELCELFWIAFQALLTRSRPPLRELCLTIPSAEHLLVPVLRLLPTLEILDFQLFPPDPAALTALTPARGEVWLCPRLSALYLANVAALDIAEVIALVKARVPPGRGPWAGGSRPVPSDRLHSETAVLEWSYLTELGVWNSKGVGSREEKRLLAFARKGGDKMKFTVRKDQDISRDQDEDESENVPFMTMTAKQFREKLRANKT